MSKSEANANMVSKTFKTKSYLLEFINKNNVKQFSVVEQNTGFWKISFPRQYNPISSFPDNEGT